MGGGLCFCTGRGSLNRLRAQLSANQTSTQFQDNAASPTRRGLSLFWRTFFLLALLLLGSIVAWLQTLRSLEFEPRAIQTAQQLASQVNLSRAALIHADAIARTSLLKTMSDQEGVHIVPREPGDPFVPGCRF